MSLPFALSGLQVSTLLSRSKTMERAGGSQRSQKTSSQPQQRVSTEYTEGNAKRVKGLRCGTCNHDLFIENDLGFQICQRCHSQAEVIIQDLFFYFFLFVLFMFFF